MPAPRRRPDTSRRRALELLASCPDGCTKAVLRAHGFTIEHMATLVRAGIATATADRVVMGRALDRDRADNHRIGGGGRSVQRRITVGSWIKLAEITRGIHETA